LVLEFLLEWDLNRLCFILLATTLRSQTAPSGCNLSRALELHRAGDFAGAASEYQTCVAVDPGRAETRSNLGAVLVRLGRFQEAIDQYRVALNVATGQVASQLRFNLALAYYKSAQISEAAAELEKLRTAGATDLNMVLLLADCRLRMGDFKAAIDLLKPLETAHPNDPALDYVLGMALIRDGHVAEGQSHVERILGRGESAEGHFLLGSAQFTAGDYPAALKEFSKAQALNPGLPSLSSYYGRALLFTGDADGAVTAFRKELAADPNDFDANFHLASILSQRGKPDEARPLLERAVQVRPGSAEARDALANGFHVDAARRDDSGVAVGTPAPAIEGLALTHPAKPVVLVFGSYTCPKLRSSAADLKRISQQYRGVADFRLVYIREAHAQDSSDAQWQSSINEREGIALAPVRNLKEKSEHADLCLRKLDLPWPAVIDGMDGTAESAYQAWPSRVYIVDRDGRVAFSSRLGELDFHPTEFEAALREILGRGVSDARPH
jgi:Flp pilus assembly protein TadD